MSVDVRVLLPSEVVDAIAERAAAIVLAQLDSECSPKSRYMTVEETCDYARWSRQRVYDLRSAGRLTRLSGVVLRDEVDALLRGER